MNQPAERLPRQVPYILGNEACERFSFYGMRNILTTFLAVAFFAHLGKDKANAEAKDIFHVFVIGVYFFPLLGGWLADRFFGKYSTILWVSMLYCVGHAFLAIFEDEPYGFYAGLLLIAIGSGGIKPLVSTFMGDQFDQTNKHLGKVAFDAFYWIINFGSFFASLLMPRLLRGDGPARWWGLTPASVAFGIPGILMGLAVIAFWLGRKRYVRVPPARAPERPPAALDSRQGPDRRLTLHGRSPTCHAERHAHHGRFHVEHEPCSTPREASGGSRPAQPSSSCQGHMGSEPRVSRGTGVTRPSSTWNRIQALAERTIGTQIAFSAGYGTTETGPGISTTHWASRGGGEIAPRERVAQPRAGAGVGLPGGAHEVVEVDAGLDAGGRRAVEQGAHRRGVDDLVVGAERWIGHGGQQNHPRGPRQACPNDLPERPGRARRRRAPPPTLTPRRWCPRRPRRRRPGGRGRAPRSDRGRGAARPARPRRSGRPRAP